MVGQVEKMVIVLPHKTVAPMVLLVPSPESCQPIIRPSLAALRTNIPLRLVVYVY